MAETMKRNRVAKLAIVLIIGAALGVGLWRTHASAKPAHGQTSPAVISEANLKALGLPSGQAHVIARHQTFPPGFVLKHVHGGPAFVYVIAGPLTISDADGNVTYNAGDYFSEPPGHIHTASAPQGAELSTFYVLSEGADATIPVP